MPAEYVNIENNLRGFNTQRDYASIEAWVKDMQKEEDGDREINWALLLRVSDGSLIRTYRRGCAPPY